MKVRVTKNVKGEIRIEAMGKTYPRGSEILMDEEQFLHSATQMAIRINFLEVLEGTTKQADGTEFRCLYKNPLSIRCVGRAINPGEVFYVQPDDVDDSEIETALAAGFIVKESDFKNQIEKSKRDLIEENSENIAAIVEEEQDSEEETEKTVVAVKKKSDTTKKYIVKKKSSKKRSNKKTKKDKTEANIPANMHVHIPNEVKDDIKPRRIPVSKDILDLDLDAPENIRELPFVDKEQAEESKSRLNNQAGENEEVV